MPISLLCFACYGGLLYTYPPHVTPIVHSLYVSDPVGPGAESRTPKATFA